MLVDVTPLGVTGSEAEALLDEVGITVNKNAIPFDPLPPNTASGIRVGTPATTTRGFGAGRDAPGRRADRRAHRAAATTPPTHDRSRAEVREICARFPVPGLPEPRDPCGSRRRSGQSCRASSCVAAALISLRADAAAIRRRRSGSARSTCPRRAAGPQPPIPRGGGLAVAVAFVGRRRSGLSCSTTGSSSSTLPVADRAIRRSPRCSSAARSARSSASSTTATSSGRAGSSLGQLVLAGARHRGRHHDRPIVNNPFGDPVDRSVLERRRSRPCVHDAVDRGHDQQHQLHRRARRAVDRASRSSPR